MLAAMAGQIPQSFINSLVERVDIVDVVGERVELRKAGANHMGRCPFHEEKTPSFHVYPDGHYHCFGCGAHGTTLGFVMDMDGLTFPEAVESLAASLGLEVPRERGRAPAADPGLYEVLEAAGRQFQRWLRDDGLAQEAHRYLSDRGLAKPLIDDFGIGLAPSGWERLKTALAGFGEDKLLAAGLLASNDRGRVYDRFRERIVFPIRDARGRAIGFGGRIFKGDADAGPKYLNSPETDVFKKGRELYGLFEARRQQRQLRELFLVEGYMDVVALAGHGIGNAVATLGTAVGQAHFEKMFRHVDIVVCCFDGDEAGRKAAWSAVDAAFPVLAEGKELRFVFLPEGEDPDSLVANHGAERFHEEARKALPVGDYLLRHLQTGLDLRRVDHRALLADLAAPHLTRLPNGALRRALSSELARLSQTSPGALEQRAEVGRATSRRWAANQAPSSKVGARLLRHLVKHPQLVAGLDADVRQRLVDACEGELLGEALRYVVEQPDADTATLLGRFAGEAAYAQLASAAAAPSLLTGAALAAEFADAAERYLGESTRRQQAALLDSVRQSGSLEDLQRLRDALA